MGDVLLYEQLQLFAQGLYRNLSLKIPHKFGKDISLSHYLPGLFETSHLATLTQLCSTLDVAIFSLNCSKEDYSTPRVHIEHRRQICDY